MNADLKGVQQPITPKKKKAWVKALCSGKYAQTKGALHRTNHSVQDMGLPVGYCCLGVAQKACRIKDVTDRAFLMNGYAVSVFLPMEVQSALAKLNDDEVPFEVIAGLIDHAL